MFSRSIRILLLVAFCLCTLFLASASFPRTALAASDPITVTSQSDTAHFPNSIDFTVTAIDTSSNITTAIFSITYYVAGLNGGPESTNHNVPIAYPAHIITLHDSESTSSSAFVLPGTPIDYSWQFQDSAGHTHTTATQHFALIDSRFTWQHLSQSLIQVFWYNRPQDFGQVLLKHAVESLAHISKVLGHGPTQPLNLWIYATPEDFRGALGPAEFEWVGGEAFPDLSQTFLVVRDSSDYTLIRDMPHEMTHLVFAQLEPHAIDVPAWFNEGLAVYNQEYHEPDLTARLQQALDTHSLLHLDDIAGGFSPNGDLAYLAYAQSWNLVSYMYSTFGQARMTQLLQALNSPLIAFADALRQTLGIDLAHLENQWHLHLGQPPTLSPGQPAQASQPQATLGGNSNLPWIVTITILLLLIALIALLLLRVSLKRRQAVER